MKWLNFTPCKFCEIRISAIFINTRCVSGNYMQIQASSPHVPNLWSAFDKLSSGHQALTIIAAIGVTLLTLGIGTYFVLRSLVNHFSKLDLGGSSPHEATAKKTHGLGVGAAFKKGKEGVEEIQEAEIPAFTAPPALFSQLKELKWRASNDGIIAFYSDEEDPLTGFLGNFHIHKDKEGKESRILAPNGKLYRCVEAAFQAMKYPPEYHDAFLNLDGEGAFQLRNKLGMKLIVPDWDTLRYQVMFQLLLAKFNPVQHPELAELLEHTGYASLVEHNMKKEDETTWSDAIYGEGHNVLGIMLEQVRKANRIGLEAPIQYADSEGVPILLKAKYDPALSHLFQPKPYNFACEVKGCMRPKYSKIPGARACGKTHANLLSQQIAPQTAAQAVSQKICELAKYQVCSKPVYNPQDPNAIACSKTHHSLAMKAREKCQYAPCQKTKRVEMLANGIFRVHDFCGKTCAKAAGFL